MAIINYAFIASRLDYCSVIYIGLPLKNVQKLQLVQNMAVCLLMRWEAEEQLQPSTICTGSQYLLRSNSSFDD